MDNATNEFVEYVRRESAKSVDAVDELNEVRHEAVIAAVKAFLEDHDGKHGVWEEPLIEAAVSLRSHDRGLYSRLSEAVKEPMYARHHREWESRIKNLAKKAREDSMEGDEPECREDAPHFIRDDDAVLALHLIAELEDRVEDECGQRVAPISLEDEELYRYQGDGGDTGLWTPVSRQRLSTRIQDWSGAPVGSGDPRPLHVSKNRVRGTIELARDRCYRPDFFLDGPDALGFNDVVMRVLPTFELDPVNHKPENRLRVKIPLDLEPAMVEYDERKNAGTLKERRFFRYLHEIFAPDDDAEEKIRALGEFIGACLFGQATRYQNAMILHGEGSNGKTILLKLVDELFPERFKCQVPPQELEGDKFQKAVLGGKRLNILGEMSDAFIKHSAAIKQVIDGHKFTASRKFKPEKTYEATAGHLYAVNELPQVRDTTDGFWRAFLVIPFNRQFKEHEKDPHLLDKLTDELGLVAAWAIEGFQRLVRQGGYTVPPSSEERKREWRGRSNNVMLFVNECCSEIPGVSKETPGTSTTQLYSKYREWCHETGHKRFAKNKFGERLEQLGHESARKMINGVQKTRRPLDFDGFT